MSKTIQQFNYSIVKGEPPYPSWVIIRLGDHGVDEHGAALSPHLLSEGEIDEHIGLLKADLDAVGKRAKAAIARSKT